MRRTIKANDKSQDIPYESVALHKYTPHINAAQCTAKRHRYNLAVNENKMVFMIMRDYLLLRTLCV